MKISFPGLHYGGGCTQPPRPGAPALRCNSAVHRYAGSDEDVLADVSFTVNIGERVALVGPNGAGKSTLLKAILGSEPLKGGEIEIFGHPAGRCRHCVAVAPQRSRVDWSFPVTVHQVVMMGRYAHMGWFKRPGRPDREAVEAALETMEIADLVNRQVGELSGGQQQRVMLARTLAQDADLLLLDEPLNHVDISTQEMIFHTLERLSARGKTAIVSTHDMGVLTVHFTRALFMDRRIIADGPPHEVLTPQTIARAYGFEFHKDYHPWTSSSNL